MITPCPSPNQEGCPYAGRCYADTDHIIPRFMSHGAPALLRNYIRSPENKQQLCRFEHDRKTIEDWQHPPEIPEARVMIDAIKRSRK